jgi:hypothetical protein
LNEAACAELLAFAEEECKRSTISLKKAGLVYNLIQKICPENGLVYDLTEIDI